MAEDGSTKFVSALTTVGDSYTDISGKAAQMQKETTTSAQEMESAARRIQDAFAPIGGDLVDMLTPGAGSPGRVSGDVFQSARTSAKFCRNFWWDCGG